MNLSEAPKEVDGHGLLADKVVLVTAAAGTGIGSSTARRAVLEGADVVVSDYHERRLKETRDQLAELGLGRVEAVVCDVTSTEAVDAMVAETVEKMGRVDVLVKNAGLGGETPLGEMTDDEGGRGAPARPNHRGGENARHEDDDGKVLQPKLAPQLGGRRGNGREPVVAHGQISDSSSAFMLETWSTPGSIARSRSRSETREGSRRRRR